MRANEFILERYDQPYDDPELRNMQNYARMHYPAMKNKTDSMLKYLQRSVKHAKQTDTHQETELGLIRKELEQLKAKIGAAK